jgi:hypothetical protein
LVALSTAHRGRRPGSEASLSTKIQSQGREVVRALLASYFEVCKVVLLVDYYPD